MEDWSGGGGVSGGKSTVKNLPRPPSVILLAVSSRGP